MVVKLDSCHVVHILHLYAASTVPSDLLLLQDCSSCHVTLLLLYLGTMLDSSTDRIYVYIYSIELHGVFESLHLLNPIVLS